MAFIEFVLILTVLILGEYKALIINIFLVVMLLEFSVRPAMLPVLILFTFTSTEFIVVILLIPEFIVSVLKLFVLIELVCSVILLKLLVFILNEFKSLVFNVLEYKLFVLKYVL